MHAPIATEIPATTTSAGGGGKTLLLSAVVAALGSFLFGFDTVVVSGTNDMVKSAFQLSDFMLGFTVMSLLIGTMLGSLLIGRPADRWGRRPVLGVLAVLFVIAALGCARAWNWYALIFFRWLGGVAVGGASVVCPIYITEIAPARRRGLLVAVSQLNIVLGILVATVSNYVVARVLGPDHPSTWRWMFGVMTVPALGFLFTALLIPESPRWLVKRGRRAEAERILVRFGYANPAPQADEIQQSLAAEQAPARPRLSRPGSGRAGGAGAGAARHRQGQLPLHRAGAGRCCWLGFGKLVWNFPRQYLKPLLLACMIGAFNQLDGINAVLYYAPSIFRMAGADKAGALMQAVIIGLTNLVMTLVAMALIDRVGRKALLLVGSVTFVMSHVLAAWVFATHAQGWSPLFLIHSSPLHGRGKVRVKVYPNNAVITATPYMSLAVAPRERSLTGRLNPWIIGP